MPMHHHSTWGPTEASGTHSRNRFAAQESSSAEQIRWKVHITRSFGSSALVQSSALIQATHLKRKLEVMKSLCARMVT